MNKLKEIWWSIEYKLSNIKSKIVVKQWKRKYSDYVDDEYNLGSLKFIWGIKSWDDLSPAHTANLYTMNDIDITYDRDTKLYSLGIETAYGFKDDTKQGECEYLKQLLNTFTKYMNDNNYSTKPTYCFFCCNCSTDMKAETIEELYTQFRIFVEGYCNVFQSA